MISGSDAASPSLRAIQRARSCSWPRIRSAKSSWERWPALSSASKPSGRNLASLTPFKLGILGNATLEPLVPALIATALRHGIDLECVGADYGLTLQEALSPDSAVNRAQPDAVLLAIDHRGLPLRPGANEPAAPPPAVRESLEFVNALRDGIASHAGALCIVQTLPAPPETVFGNLDRAVPRTLRSLTTAFNAALVESLENTHDVILDVAALAETVGLANWYSPAKWNIGKFAFDPKFLPLYADHVCRIVAAIRGKSRKCLVLDLDNTLWGGVIGDDGLEGIVLGQGDPTGEAYLDVQRTALELRERGIVLAVSSKNSDEVARAAFARHPEMLLRERHIAVFQANWNDKASNLAAIASELALGIDSLVFLDDNPVERASIRHALPEVAVPELPADPALIARTLSAAGYFESVAFSDEDRRRAAFYEDNARRVALKSQVGDTDAYLASLDMEIVFRPFDATGRSRIAQLVNKSNQFNRDDPPVHGSGSRRLRSRPELLHASSSAARQIRRQRDDRRCRVPGALVRGLGDRHVADELPRARPPSRAYGTPRNSLSRPRSRHRETDRGLSADRQERHREGPLPEARFSDRTPG